MVSGRSTFACHINTWRLTGQSCSKCRNGNSLVVATQEWMTLTLSLMAVLFGVPASEQHGHELPALPPATSVQSSIAEANIKTPASCMHLRCKSMFLTH